MGKGSQRDRRVFAQKNRASRIVTNVSTRPAIKKDPYPEDVANMTDAELSAQAHRLEFEAGEIGEKLDEWKRYDPSTRDYEWQRRAVGALAVKHKLLVATRNEIARRCGPADQESSHKARKAREMFVTLHPQFAKPLLDLISELLEATRPLVEGPVDERLMGPDFVVARWESTGRGITAGEIVKARRAMGHAGRLLHFAREFGMTHLPPQPEKTDRSHMEASHG